MSDREYAVRPNKTQLKREMRALNQLGKELISLADSSLKNVPLSDEMRLAIEDGRRFSRGALQRQLRLIVKLLQHEDLEAINLELARLKQPSQKQTAEFHQLEQWRDRLVDGDEQLLTDLIQQYAQIDRQYIRQLMRNAVRERQLNKPPKAARLLFKYLSKIQKTDALTSENADSKSYEEINTD